MTDPRVEAAEIAVREHLNCQKADLGGHLARVALNAAHPRTAPTATIYLTNGTTIPVHGPPPSAADLHEARFITVGVWTIRTARISHIRTHWKAPA